VIAPAENQNIQTGQSNGSRHPVSDAQLLEEMRYLDQARTAMRSGRASNVMRWLSEYRQNYPAQRLMPEALLLGMQAAARQGDISSAQALAREICAGFPKSPHAAKAREYLDASTRRSTEQQSDGD